LEFSACSKFFALFRSRGGAKNVLAQGAAIVGYGSGFESFNDWFHNCWLGGWWVSRSRRSNTTASVRPRSVYMPFWALHAYGRRAIPKISCVVLLFSTWLCFVLLCCICMYFCLCVARHLIWSFL